jgi:hypothetical protein
MISKNIAKQKTVSDTDEKVLKWTVSEWSFMVLGVHMPIADFWFMIHDMLYDQNMWWVHFEHACVWDWTELHRVPLERATSHLILTSE